MRDELDEFIADDLRECYARRGKPSTPEGWRQLCGDRRLTARQFRAYRRLVDRLNRGLPRHMRVRKGPLARARVKP